MMKRKKRNDRLFIVLWLLSYGLAFYLGLAVAVWLEYRVGINGTVLVIPLGILLIWFGYMWRDFVENRDK